MEVYLSLTNNTHEGSSLATALTDEYSRLGVWGSSVAVDRTGRGSLDGTHCVAIVRFETWSHSCCCP